MMLRETWWRDERWRFTKLMSIPHAGVRVRAFDVMILAMDAGLRFCQCAMIAVMPIQGFGQVRMKNRAILLFIIAPEFNERSG